MRCPRFDKTAESLDSSPSLAAKSRRRENPNLRNQEFARPAYGVASSRVVDPVEYKKYTDPLPAIFAKYGAKVLARGGRFQIMEGPEKFHRFVVIEFPTFEQGVACFGPPESQAAPACRRNGAGEVETFVVDAGDATPR